MNVARQAGLKAGLPVEVPGETVNRVCGSGLQAVVHAVEAIRVGYVDTMVAGGTESMSNAPYLLKGARWGYRMGNGEAIDSMLHEGLTCAIGAVPHGHHRRRSGGALQRVARGSGRVCRREPAARRPRDRAKGASRTRSCPVPVPQRKGDPVIVDTDEYPRAGTTAEKLAALKPAFKKDGTVTAGNASGINDGAAALVVTTDEEGAGARREAAGADPGVCLDRRRSEDHGHRTGAGRAQGARARRSEDRRRRSVRAERSVCRAVARRRSASSALDPAKVNVNGGAIALGHPIGASGARVLTTLIYALRARKLRYGVASLCIGGGMGIAMAVEALWKSEVRSSESRKLQGNHVTTTATFETIVAHAREAAPRRVLRPAPRARRRRVVEAVPARNMAVVAGDAVPHRPEGSHRRDAATRGRAASMSSASITRIRTRRRAVGHRPRRSQLSRITSTRSSASRADAAGGAAVRLRQRELSRSSRSSQSAECSGPSALVGRRAVSGWFAPAALHAQDLRRPRSARADRPRDPRHRRQGAVGDGVRRRCGVSGRRAAAPIRPNASRESVQRHYRDEGYTFARVRRRSTRRPASLSLDDRRRRRSTASSSRASTRSSRGRSPTSSRCAPATCSTASAPGRRSTRCCARRAARSAPADVYSATVHRQRRARATAATAHVRSRRSRRPAHPARRPARAAGRASRSCPTSASAKTGSTPVDGFVPSLGLGIAVFDHDRFNHTFVAGHLSYKVGVGAAPATRSASSGRCSAATKLYRRRRAARPDRQRRSVAGLVDRGEPRRGRAAPQLPRLLPPPRRADQRRAARPPAGRAAVRLARRAAGARWRSRATSASGTATSRSGRTCRAADGRLNALVVGASVDGRGFDQRIARSDLPASSARDAVRRAARRVRMAARSAADLAHRLDVGDLRRRGLRAATSTSGATSSAAARACALSQHQDVRRPRDRRLVRTACCRRSGSSRSAASGRCTATTSRRQVGDTLALLNLEYALGWRSGLKLFGLLRRRPRQPVGGPPPARRG